MALEINFQSLALTKLSAENLYRSDDAQIFQLRRVQFVR